MVIIQVTDIFDKLFVFKLIAPTYHYIFKEFLIYIVSIELLFSKQINKKKNTLFEFITKNF